jgi:protein kinase A
MCITPEYAAPEIILCKGHGKAADWWSLGILIYELLIGSNPFISDDPLVLYQNIIECKIRFPYIEVSARSFISQLLQAESSLRIGTLAGGVDEVKSHQFFDKLNFSKIQKMEVKSPINVDIDDVFIEKYFIDYIEKKEDGTHLNKNQDPFLDW